MSGPREGGIGGLGIAGAPVEADVARHFVGDQRRAGGARCVARRHGGQRLVVDLDQFGGVGRLRGALGHDQRDRLAGKPHLVVRQQRLRREGKGLAGLDVGLGVGPQRLQSIGRRIGRRQHGEHARGALGRARVDRADAGVGMRRAQHDGVGQPIEAQVVEIGALAGDEARILAAPWRCADSGLAHVRNVSAFLAWRFSSHQSLACSFQ